MYVESQVQVLMMEMDSLLLCLLALNNSILIIILFNLHDPWCVLQAMTNGIMTPLW